MGQEIAALKTDMTHMDKLCASKSGPYDCIGSTVISVDNYCRPFNNLFTKVSMSPTILIVVSLRRAKLFYCLTLSPSYV